MERIWGSEHICGLTRPCGRREKVYQPALLSYASRAWVSSHRSLQAPAEARGIGSVHSLPLSPFQPVVYTTVSDFKQHKPDGVTP